MSGGTGGDDRTAVINAMQRLGFGTNEAKVMIGLTELGTATARELSRVTDVSRPQVYSAVEGLERHGLVNVQQANPKQFQPVTPDEAESLLMRSFADDVEQVTDHLQTVAAQRERPTEEREEIWTVRGQAAVSERVVQLARGADERVVLTIEREELLTEEITAVLKALVEEGVAVLAASTAPAVRERLNAEAGVVAVDPEEYTDAEVETENDHTGRMLLVDNDTVLHSVLGEEELPGVTRETAYWSSGTGFAATLVAMMEQFLEQHDDAVAERTE